MRMYSYKSNAGIRVCLCLSVDVCGCACNNICVSVIKVILTNL